MEAGQSVSIAYEAVISRRLLLLSLLLAVATGFNVATNTDGTAVPC